MKRQIGVAMLVALTALAGFASGARAQCTTGMMFAWGENAFAYESNYNPATFISSNGSQLNVVGVLTVACQMFSGLNPSDLNKEYTFLLTGLTSGGTTGPTPLAGGSTRWTTSYTGGNFFIYEGTPRNAPSALAMPPSPPNADVPSKYTDGTLILNGTLSGFSTTITRFSNGNYSNSFRGNYVFTPGGTLFGLVGPENGLLQGTWEANDDADPGKIGLLDLPAGYSAHPIGKFDQPVTATQSSTWGTIKQLYR